jgi:hypothetical protein
VPKPDDSSIWARAFGRPAPGFVSANEERARKRLEGGANLYARWRAFRQWMMATSPDATSLEAAEMGFYAGAASMMALMESIQGMGPTGAARVAGHLRRELEEFAARYDQSGPAG